jgi:hypothetical protein
MRNKPFAFLLVLAASLAATQVPLLNTLGYESSLAFAALLSLVCGFVCLSDDRPLVQKLFTTLQLTLVPLVVLFANGAFVQNCSPVDGVLFYLLNTVMGVAFGVSLAAFVGAASERFLGGRFPRVAFVLYWLGVLAVPTAERFLASPQIFFFNHVIGFFAGSIYDEAVGVDWRLVAFRLQTLMLCGVLTWLAIGLRSRDKRAWGVAILFLAGVATIERFAVPLGLKADTKTVEENLSVVQVIQTPDVTLRIHSKSSDAKRFGRSEKKYLNDLTQKLNVKNFGTIDVFVYPNADDKKRFTGADETEFTKIWLNQIHLTTQSYPATIKHELTHILANQFGLTIFGYRLGLSTSIGLVEGIAEYCDGEDFDYTADEFSAGILKAGLANGNLESYLGAFGFWTSLSGTSYTLMASFVKYLAETYGIDKFKGLYPTSDFEKAYGSSASSLVAAWRATLEKIPVTPALANAVRYRFERPTLFQKSCPHQTATLLKAAGKLAAEKNYVEAYPLYLAAAEASGRTNLRALQSYEQNRRAAAITGQDSLELLTNDFIAIQSRFGDVKTAGYHFMLLDDRVQSLVASDTLALSRCRSDYLTLYNQHISFWLDLRASMKMLSIDAARETGVFVKRGKVVDMIQSLSTAADDRQKNLFRLWIAETLTGDRTLTESDTVAVGYLKSMTATSCVELTVYRAYLLKELGALSESEKADVLIAVRTLNGSAAKTRFFEE